jgi:hypothetical protein
MSSPARPRSSAYVDLPIADFCETPEDALLGRLVASSGFDIELTQRGAWTDTFPVLREALAGLAGHLYLEFDVPRLGSRIDAVVISGPAIIPIEFKAGEANYPREAINQAWDYALDLKNFHRASHDAPVFPILVATEAPDRPVRWDAPHHDGVRPPLCCNGTTLGAAVRAALDLADGAALDEQAWGRAPYHPTPTIIQAAQALYAGHSVDAISRSDAGAENLTITSRRVEEVIETARRDRTKAIVFVTGVPGAGKTLVGLNIATQRRDESTPTHAVFLSGNGPLVAVLREALVRDEVSRRKEAGERVRKGEVAQPVKQFIQNVHHFRDDGLKRAEPPIDHVVIFDEAQRAWNESKTTDFMRRRKSIPDFNQSEPAFLISVMDRHPDWAVIVCLVGGGQEIHTGEAGIAAWLEAVRERFPHWQVHISPRLTDAEFDAVASIRQLAGSTRVLEEPNLHLNVSMRSFRAERVSEFVKLVLDTEVDRARELLLELTERYPMALTRDLNAAREWIRERARGNERYGLVASSQAMRLKPHAIDVRVDVDPIHWFLNEREDTRSSWYLEDAATEFQVQGLELDWAIVTWDADLRYTREGWRHHQFRGKKWEQSHKEERQRYLVNAYRVLLTRARQGMVIFVPPGDPMDPTRKPAYYDGTYEYLRGVGV